MSGIHIALGGRNQRLRHPLISINNLPLGASIAKGASNVLSWNPSDKSTNIVLSGYDLIATATSTSAAYAVRATKPRGADGGKWYFEALLGAGCTASKSFQIGLMTSAASINNGLGTAGNTGCCAYDLRGYKYLSSVYTGISLTATQGNVICIAWDSDAGKVWWAKDGVWMQSGNPNIGASPMYTSATLIGERYPAISFYGPHVVANTSAITLKIRPSDFSYPVPAGFRAWNRI